MTQECDYDNQAKKWIRTEPSLSSDFFGRPELIKDVIKFGKDRDLIDAGCGEGYTARIVRPYAKSLTGFDLSKGMIDCALHKEIECKQGINYLVGDIRKIPVNDKSFDVYFSSLVFHYLKPEELVDAYSEINRVLRPNGTFLVMISHPKSLESICKTPKKSIWLTEQKDFDYEKSRGEYFDMKIKDLKGNILNVGIVHSTFEDHEKAIKDTGLKLSGIDELTLTEEILKNNNKFYELMKDRVETPLWTIIKGYKE